MLVTGSTMIAQSSSKNSWKPPMRGMICGIPIAACSKLQSPNPSPSHVLIPMSARLYSTLVSSSVSICGCPGMTIRDAPLAGSTPRLRSSRCRISTRSHAPLSSVAMTSLIGASGRLATTSAKACRHVSHRFLGWLRFRLSTKKSPSEIP